MPTSTYTPIATTTASGSTSSVTFSSISGSYTDLRLVVSHKISVGTGGIQITYNGDTATNYSYTNLYGDGTNAASARATNANYIAFTNSETTNFNIGLADIMNYANTTTNKTLVARGATPSSFVTAWVGLWRNTSAITSITVTAPSPANFSAGSTFTLYGVKSA